MKTQKIVARFNDSAWHDSLGFYYHIEAGYWSDVPPERLQGEHFDGAIYAPLVFEKEIQNGEKEPSDVDIILEADG
jgi:hypothetical protein